MSKQILTVPQYAEANSKDRTSVFRAAKANKLHLLPGVSKIKKINKYFILEMFKA